MTVSKPDYCTQQHQLVCVLPLQLILVLLTGLEDLESPWLLGHQAAPVDPAK